jgi:hypothetical protein
VVGTEEQSRVDGDVCLVTSPLHALNGKDDEHTDDRRSHAPKSRVNGTAHVVEM